MPSHQGQLPFPWQNPLHVGADAKSTHSACSLPSIQKKKKIFLFAVVLEAHPIYAKETRQASLTLLKSRHFKEETGSRVFFKKKNSYLEYYFQRGITSIPMHNYNNKIMN